MTSWLHRLLLTRMAAALRQHVTRGWVYLSFGGGKAPWDKASDCAGRHA